MKLIPATKSCQKVVWDGHKSICKALFPYEDLWADVPKIQNENLTCPQCRKVHEINSIVVLQFNTDSNQPKDGSIDHSQDGGFSQEGTQELPSTTDPGQSIVA